MYLSRSISKVPGVVLLTKGNEKPSMILISLGIGPTIPKVDCSLNCSVTKFPVLVSSVHELLFTARYTLLVASSTLTM